MDNYIANFRLVGSEVRHITVSGLEVTTNDAEVESYFREFGARFVSKEVEYCTFKTGKWKWKKIQTEHT